MVVEARKSATKISQKDSIIRTNGTSKGRLPKKDDLKNFH